MADLRTMATDDIDSTTDGWQSRGAWLMVVLSGLAAVVLLGVATVAVHAHTLLNFRFTPYAIPTAATCVLMLVAIVLMARVRRHTFATVNVMILLGLLCGWSWAEMMSRLSATPQAFVFWGQFRTLGLAFLPTAMYLFAASYTQSRYAKHPLTILATSAVPSIVLFLTLRTSLITDYDPGVITHYDWGYVEGIGPLYGLLTIWYVLVGMATLIQMRTFAQKVRQLRARRQAQLIMYGMFGTFFVGSITDGLLPALHIGVVPYMAAMLTSALGLVLCASVLRARYDDFSVYMVAQQILDTMSEAVIGFDDTLTINYANKGAERLLKMPIEGLLGASFAGYIADSQAAAQVGADLRAATIRTKVQAYEALKIVTADQRTFSATVSISTTESAYIATLTDVTAMVDSAALIAHKVDEQTATIRKARTELVTAVNSVQFGFLICSAEPEVVLINDVAHSLFCGSPQHLASDCTVVTLARIVKASDAWYPLQQSLGDCLASGMPQKVASTVFQHRTWRVDVTPILQDRVAVGATVVLQDVTEEQVLARSRDEFFSIASHELRTPLAAIKGNAALMLQYFGDQLGDPAMREMVTDIRESSERLIEIVGDFLDASRLEQGRISYRNESFTMADCVEKVIYEMSSTARGTDVSIVLAEALRQRDGLPQVYADRNRVTQIMYNLIGNAVKFTDHGTVTIDAQVRASSLLVTVRDTGRGVPVELQPLLFRKFQQAGDSLLTRDTARGTGLGLYISRLLAHGMGGALDLEYSRPGEGTGFVLTLPLATEADSTPVTN